MLKQLVDIKDYDPDNTLIGTPKKKKKSGIKMSQNSWDVRAKPLINGRNIGNDDE